jgi:RNA polymerase sigma factor for flagellar operon FliA
MPPRQTLPESERERLILEHQPQVLRLARWIHGRMPANVSLDDLVSTGNLGLIAAIDSFDPSRHASLKTYAEHKIQGRILDSLRQQDWAPREQRKHAKQIAAAIAVLEQRLQRAPTEEEIATELNLTLERYHQWHVNVRGMDLARLEPAGPLDAERRNLLDVVSGDSKMWPSAVLERSEARSALTAAIAGLPDVEKTILGLYYSGGLSQTDISTIIGVHKSRIALLAKQAILRLRVGMAEHWPSDGLYPSFIAMLEAGSSVN